MLPLADAFAQEMDTATLWIFSILLSSHVPLAVTSPSTAPLLTRYALFALSAITATTKMRSRVLRAKRDPTIRVGDL